MQRQKNKYDQNSILLIILLALPRTKKYQMLLFAPKQLLTEICFTLTNDEYCFTFPLIMRLASFFQPS